MKRRALNLALSGAPSFGGYIWGTLDALLADTRIEIAGISATGISAVCAAVLAASAVRGPLAARQALAEFWYDVAHGDWPVPVVPPNRLGELDFDNVASAFAAIPMEPLKPLRALLQRHLDLHALRRAPPWPVFVSATDIESGKLRVFRAEELDEDALLASVASPFCTWPVWIDGHLYWGGGLGGDPPLYPLLYESKSADILLVTRRPPPTETLRWGSVEIFGRIWSLSTTQSLDAELRSMMFVQNLLSKGRLDAAQYRDLRLHRIALDPEVDDSRLPHHLPEHILELRRMGVSDVDRWLADHMGDIGRRSTFDVHAYLQAER